MKKFKKIDVSISILLFFIGVAVNVFDFIPGFGKLDLLIPAYFVLGGWQMISILVHFSFPKRIKHPSRQIYNWLLVGTGVSVLLAWIVISEFIIWYLFFVLIWTIFLAIFYTWICVLENNRMVECEALGDSFNTEVPNGRIPVDPE
ncbi:MAG: hypothetical protein H7Y31_16260 [Chitinophagaceae bacterium]|nr:hypothetical protein [Chitinophagaceae bacterium]